MNKSNVTVSLAATDNPGGSGVKQITYSANGAQNIATTTVSGASAAVNVTVEGITDVAFFATDNAGNVEAPPKALTVKLDRTAPSTSTSLSTPANPNGWHTGDVSVTLSADDAFSGVAKTEYKLNTSTWTPYSAPIAITSEGVHAIQYRSLDKADNLEGIRTLAVRLDKTAPEAHVQFDPATKDLAIFGTDAQSGAPVAAVTPASVKNASWAKQDEGEDHWRAIEEFRPFAPLFQELLGSLLSQPKVELRTYRVTDLAGNTLDLVVKARKVGPQVKARLVSLQYGGATVMPAPDNSMHFVWQARGNGNPTFLLQHMKVGKGQEKEMMSAVFSAKDNETVIVSPQEAKPNRVTRKPGLVLLRVETETARLDIDF